MKRILAVCMAVALMMGFVSTGYAGGIAGVQSGGYMFTLNAAGFQNQTINSGATVGYPLGLSAFTAADSRFSYDEVTAEQVAKLRINVGDNRAAEFNAQFTTQFVLDNKWVWFRVTPRAVTQDTPFNFRLGVMYPSDEQATGYYSTQLAPFTGTIKAPATVDPTTSEIIGINSTTDSASYAMKPEERMLFSLPSDFFKYSNAIDNVITVEKVGRYGITATSTDSNFQALVVQDNNLPYVQFTANANIAPGIYNTSLVISGNNLGFGTLVNLKITVGGTSGGNTSGKIIGIDPNARLGYDANGIFSRASRNGYALSSDENIQNLVINAGDEVNLEFYSDFFLWENGKPNPRVSVNSSMIRNGRITAKILNGSGSNIVESVNIRYSGSQAYLCVKFVDHFVSTKDKDFSLTVGLACDGSVNRDTFAILSGTMENMYTYVYKDTDYIDISYGEIAMAEEAISRVDVYLGEGVTIRTRMIKNKKYYGVVTTDPTNSDFRLMERYRDIDMIYYLQTVGLNGSGSRVTLDLPDRYHIYNSQLEYLGTTASNLPYSTKYYLATRKLDIVDDSDLDVEFDDLSDGQSSAGSSVPQATVPGVDVFENQVPMNATPGNTYPENSNGNPINGR